MRSSVGAAASGIILAAVLLAVPKPSHADTIKYADGGFGSVQQSLSGLGYNLSDPSIESTAETFIVPGMSGGSTRLDFTYVRDTGSYRFSFGVFDRGAVTADPVSDRQNWVMQALGASTVVFDDRDTDPGATRSLDFVAGTDLGLFLIPNDTLAAVLEDPTAFYGVSRPDPLFSVSDANPGGFDQLMTFEAGGLTAFAFEDLSRAGYSDQDFTDLVITMTATALPGQFQVLTEIGSTEIAEPSGLAILILSGLSLILLKAWRRT